VQPSFALALPGVGVERDPARSRPKQSKWDDLMSAELNRSWLDYLVAAVALFGFLVGIYEYLVNRRWERSRWAAEQLQRLGRDPELVACCSFLDWPERKVVLPERYRPYAVDLIFNIRGRSALK
jgi:hypothetical protein